MNFLKRNKRITQLQQMYKTQEENQCKVIKVWEFPHLQK